MAKSLARFPSLQKEFLGMVRTRNAWHSQKLFQVKDPLLLGPAYDLNFQKASIFGATSRFNFGG
jgi:hypothetical protein